MTARTTGWIGVALMVAALVYGFTAGDFGAEGSQILDLAWGRVTLIDLYTGLFLIGGWIVWREGSLITALPWLVGMVFLGALAAAAYVVTTGTMEKAMSRKLKA
jgi:hypothetical protein